MSEPLDLAASIRANTAAVQALTAVVTRLFPTERIVVPKVDVAAERIALQDAAAEDEAFAAITPVRVKTEKSPSGDSEVTLDDVKKAATALAKKDREALAAALVKFQADKVSNLKPEQYRPFFAHILA